MSWEDTLTPEQRNYASCELDRHTVLLAGPGTGKTYTIVRKVAYMINVKKICADEILIMTFTRVAAKELLISIRDFIESESLPTISTLHSFALKQLILNMNLVADYQLPIPIRIIDDWEEKNIIHEELKEILDCTKNEIKENFLLLSADWDTLKADDEGRSDRFIANFLSVWEDHRQIYKYILRSELVYQVKRTLEEISNFKLENDYKYVIIDEFQDLNRCDLALIYALKDRSSIIFGIGDDDQSIYGFRHAFPIGIRNFGNNFNPYEQYTLKICQRCDKKIIRLSKFVANKDINRIPKELSPKEDAEDGEIHLYRFTNQFREAKGIAYICKQLIDEKNYNPEDILILLRIDSNQKFSDIIKKEIEKLEIPVSNQGIKSPLDLDNGRLLLSFLRLIKDFNDSISLRSIFHLRRSNNIGTITNLKIYNLAKERNISFIEMSEMIHVDPSLLMRFGNRIKTEMANIKEIVNRYIPIFSALEELSSENDIRSIIRQLLIEITENHEDNEVVLDFLYLIIQESEINTLDELLNYLSSSLKDVEQEEEENTVNILTMHKAKGLTAKAVIIAAAEQEYIPGRQQEEPEKFDELRLLYVSISRAKHYLAITFCNKRTGQQKYTGTSINTSRRHLSEFLKNIPFLRAETFNP